MQGSETNETKQEEAEVRQVNTIAFNNEDDGDLIGIINVYTKAFNKHVMQKTSPRNAIRNFLTKNLPIATKEIEGDNGDKPAEQG